MPRLPRARACQHLGAHARSATLRPAVNTEGKYYQSDVNRVEHASPCESTCSRTWTSALKAYAKKRNIDVTGVQKADLVARVQYEHDECGICIGPFLENRINAVRHQFQGRLGEACLAKASTAMAPRT